MEHQARSACAPRNQGARERPEPFSAGRGQTWTHKAPTHRGTAPWEEVVESLTRKGAGSEVIVIGEGRRRGRGAGVQPGQVSALGRGLGNYKKLAFPGNTHREGPELGLQAPSLCISLQNFLSQSHLHLTA